MARLSQEKKQELVKGSNISDSPLLKSLKIKMEEAISAFVKQAESENQGGIISLGISEALKNKVGKEHLKWVKHGL